MHPRPKCLLTYNNYHKAEHLWGNHTFPDCALHGLVPIANAATSEYEIQGLIMINTATRESSYSGSFGLKKLTLRGRNKVNVFQFPWHQY